MRSWLMLNIDALVPVAELVRWPRADFKDHCHHEVTRVQLGRRYEPKSPVSEAEAASDIGGDSATAPTFNGVFARV